MHCLETKIIGSQKTKLIGESDKHCVYRFISASRDEVQEVIKAARVLDGYDPAYDVERNPEALQRVPEGIALYLFFKTPLTSS